MSAKSVQVVARLRPALSDQEDLCTFAYNDGNQVDIVNFRNKEERLDFSRVFDQSASQEDVFAATVDPVLDDLFRGYNASILAYGPTGAGKTYTTLGTSGEPGIIPRAVNGLLDRMELNTDLCDSQLSFSYLEIYNEKLIDLLVKEQPGRDLTIREDTNRCIHVSGLVEKTITTYDDFSLQFGPASKRRTVASTKCNQYSSRSHSIIMLKLRVQPKTSKRSLVAKLYIIDLAGSENNKKTGNRGIRLKESGAINNSLFVLGQVVEALNHNVARIPYRDSKLTRLLQDSFGGSAQAVVITNLAPELSHYMLTYTTLNFAQKTRQVVNMPLINEGTPLVQRTFEPVFNAPKVVVAEPDSSLPTPSSMGSFTPLRESLLSPINHARDDISHLSLRMEKLESLLELQVTNQIQPTLPVEDAEEAREEAPEPVIETEMKENRSPSPVPLKKMRRRFEWGSPLEGEAGPSVESPLDSSALFPHNEKPIKRRTRVKSTAVKRTPAKVKGATFPTFETPIRDPDVKREHYDEILRVLNEGNTRALCKLATMGAKRSQAIMDYRKYVGPFDEILDIRKVPAFTKAFVEKFLKTNYLD